MSKVAQPAHGHACWFWTASLFKTGYGQFRLKNMATRAHRISWEIANRCRVPAGKLVLHSCGVRRCVNFDHLRLGTHKDNLEDAKIHGNPMGRKKQTHCVNGHAFDPNKKDQFGFNRCWICQKAKSKLTANKKRENECLVSTPQ